MDVSAVQLQPLRLSKNAMDFIRSMAGREIRATVLRGGAQVLLRTGGVQIEARLQGRPLEAGQNLYLRVEKDHGGRFRLVVLNPPAASAALNAPAFSGLSTPLATLFAAFLRHTQKSSKPSASEQLTSKAASPDSSAGRAQGDTDASMKSQLRESLRRITQQLPAFQDGALREAMLRLPDDANADLFFAQGVGNESGAEPVKGEYVAGLGRLAEAPFYFLTEMRARSLGRIGALFLAPDAEFRRLSLFLHPEEADTARRLEQEIAEWRRELAGAGVMFDALELVAPRENAGGGGLLNVQV